MSRPNFIDLARSWLVRAQGHARAPHEQSLAEELRAAYELGAAHAIEIVQAAGGADGDLELGSAEVDEIVARIRDATGSTP